MEMGGEIFGNLQTVSPLLLASKENTITTLNIDSLFIFQNNINETVLML